ncbi:hypothetical protein J6TS1_17630 [Siminovitchia terrae]|uniref:Uncharacterized protein n=1 Tax=Siminovitchia terrae TaxID=1914933 RepID=A0ABQ4KV43_SIMTE|nr:hypothetical protein J6TS1_17630 [Siminovitchia terrae]
METERISFIKVSDDELYANLIGNGEPIVFLRSCCVIYSPVLWN